LPLNLERAMSVHHEDMVKHGIGRLQDSVADLIDNSQALARTALAEATHALQHSREQAADAAQDALRFSRDRAQKSYGQMEKMAGRQPVAAIAIGVAIGAVLGFVLHAGAAKSRPTARSPKAPSAAKTAGARVASKPMKGERAAKKTGDGTGPIRRKRTATAPVEQTH
jgi:ElaB/YqjD/DUF883 family membrane-anchored ribosome-binding protein